MKKKEPSSDFSRMGQSSVSDKDECSGKLRYLLQSHFIY